MITRTLPKAAPYPSAATATALGPLPISEEDLLAISLDSPLQQARPQPVAPSTTQAAALGPEPSGGAPKPSRPLPRPRYATHRSEGSLTERQRFDWPRHRAMTAPDYLAVSGLDLPGAEPAAHAARYFTSRLELANPPNFYAVAMEAFAEKLRERGDQLSSAQLQEVQKHHRSLVALDRRHAQASADTDAALRLRREVHDRAARMNEALIVGPRDESCAVEDALAASSPEVAYELSQLQALVLQADRLEHALFRRPDTCLDGAVELFSLRLTLLKLRREILDEQRQLPCALQPQSLVHGEFCAQAGPKNRQKVLVQLRAQMANLTASTPRPTPALTELLESCQEMLTKARTLGRSYAGKSNRALTNFLPMMKLVTEDLRRLNDDVAEGRGPQPDAAHRAAMHKRLVEREDELDGILALTQAPHSD